MFKRVRGVPGHAFVEEQQVSDQLTCQVANGQTQVTLITAGEGNANPLQYSCLENFMNREELGGLQSIGLHRVGHN